MKAIDKQWEAAGRPGSIEIKISPLRFNLWCTAFILLFFLGASALYMALWEQQTAYDWGHYLGTFFAYRNMIILGIIFVTYLAIDALMLYLMTGCSRSTLHWQCDSVGIGFYSDHPILLGYYRLLLLTPGTLLGFLPAAYGLCTGNDDCYVWGLWGIACALFDLNLYWRLRYYKNNDYYLSTGKSYEGWLIVRSL